jgi:hypothetical protein
MPARPLMVSGHRQPTLHKPGTLTFPGITCRISKGLIVHFGGNVKESEQNGLVLCVRKPQKKAKSSNVKYFEKLGACDGELRVPV